MRIRQVCSLESLAPYQCHINTRHATPGGRLLLLLLVVTQMKHSRWLNYSLHQVIFFWVTAWVTVSSYSPFGNQDELLHRAEELRRVYDNSLGLSEGYWGALTYQWWSLALSVWMHRDIFLENLSRGISNKDMTFMWKKKECDLVTWKSCNFSFQFNEKSFGLICTKLFLIYL